MLSLSTIEPACINTHVRHTISICLQRSTHYGLIIIRTVSKCLQDFCHIHDINPCGPSPNCGDVNEPSGPTVVGHPLRPTFLIIL